MNGRDALKLMARSYPGGIEAVALRLGKAAGTLEKELGNAKGFKFSEDDAESLASFCVEVNAPHAAAWLLSVAAIYGAKVTLPDTLGVPGEDILQCLSHVVHETSDVTTAIVQGQKDGSLSPNDKRHIRKETLEAMEALQRVLRIVGEADE